MDLEIIKVLAVGLGGIGSAIGIGLIGSKAMEAIGRNPESSQKLFVPMILGMALAEGVVFFVILAGFLFGGN